MLQIVRERTAKDKTSREAAYGITSLGRSAADAGRLLELSRGHWHIENRLHHRRDVTFGEDASRVRSGSAPQVLAAVRNVAPHLVEALDFPSTAAALRRFAAKPFEVPVLLKEH